MAQTRTSVVIKFEPDDDDRPTSRYRLERQTTRQSRRSDRERWYDDPTQPDWHVREVIATLTRRELSALIQEGVDWLAWGGGDQ